MQELMWVFIVFLTVSNVLLWIYILGMWQNYRVFMSGIADVCDKLIKEIDDEG